MTTIHEENHYIYTRIKMCNIHWALFLIFVFGPCEPLIPLIMYPAAKLNFILYNICVRHFCNYYCYDDAYDCIFKFKGND